MAPMITSLTRAWNSTIAQSHGTSKAHYQSLADVPSFDFDFGNDARKLETIGPGADHLLAEMRSMYWAGVRRELKNILLALKTWQQEDFADIILEDEKGEQWIHGYDTFVDSVSEWGREAAKRYRERRDGSRHGGYSYYDEALREYGEDLKISVVGTTLRKAIRDTLETRGVPDILERRARMLLQSAGGYQLPGLISQNLTFYRLLGHR